MNSAASGCPELAGTVIVLREYEGPQVLLIRRRPELRFMGGYWVFPGGAAGHEDIVEDPVDRAARAACRELEEETHLHVHLSSLVRWAHWITPVGAARRFDTHFFVTTAPPGQPVVIDQSESSDYRWITVAIEPDLQGVDTVAPPTQMVLRELAQALANVNSVSELMALAPSRSVHTVLPKLTGTGYALMPWSPDYGGLSTEGLDWTPEAVAARVGWPDRIRAIVRSRNPVDEGPGAER